MGEEKQRRGRREKKSVVGDGRLRQLPRGGARTSQPFDLQPSWGVEPPSPPGQREQPDSGGGPASDAAYWLPSPADSLPGRLHRPALASSPLSSVPA